MQYEIYLTSTERKIMDISGRKPMTTLAEFSRQMRVSRTTIATNIARLKKMQFVKRIGSDKNGYWAVQKSISTFDPSSR
ncbi:MAG TPA: HTH domain-containing protein [Puia sp.]|nr:HTH domain-containing protein [Puia sp.]